MTNPPHLSEPQRQLLQQALSLVKAGLYQHNLAKLAQAFQTLIQDSPRPIGFYVLKHICMEMERNLDPQPVRVDDFNLLTNKAQTDLSQAICHLLDNEAWLPEDELNRLIIDHFGRLEAFRAG